MLIWCLAALAAATPTEELMALISGTQSDSAALVETEKDPKDWSMTQYMLDQNHFSDCTVQTNCQSFFMSQSLPPKLKDRCCIPIGSEEECAETEAQFQDLKEKFDRAHVRSYGTDKLTLTKEDAFFFRQRRLILKGKGTNAYVAGFFPHCGVATTNDYANRAFIGADEGNNFAICGCSVRVEEEVVENQSANMGFMFFMALIAYCCCIGLLGVFAFVIRRWLKKRKERALKKVLKEENSGVSVPSDDASEEMDDATGPSVKEKLEKMENRYETRGPDDPEETDGYTGSMRSQ